MPLFCGLTVKNPPLHTVANWLEITGVGFTETVNKNGVPTQLPLVGVTSYTISWFTLVEFTSVWEILFWAVDTADCPDKLLLSVLIVQV